MLSLTRNIGHLECWLFMFVVRVIRVDLAFLLFALRKILLYHENDYISHLMKIYTKISENHKKENQNLSSFLFSLVYA